MRTALFALGLVGVAHAGEVRHTAPLFAGEIIAPEAVNDLVMPGTDLAYVFGIDLDQRPLELRFDFGPAELNTPIAAGRLSLEINSPFGQDAALVAEVIGGGRPGDDSVTFSVRLQGIVSADDALRLDLEGVALRVPGGVVLGEAPPTVRGTLRDVQGVIDAAGDRDAPLLRARPCIQLGVTPGGRGLSAVPSGTFVGLPRAMDDSAEIFMALDACLRADGRAVRGIEDLGSLVFDLAGDIEPIDRVELRGLGLFSRLDASMSLAVEQGPIDFDGPVRIRVDGQTVLPEQILNLTIDFNGRVPGTSERLHGPQPLTRWEPVDRRLLVNVVPLDGEVECAHGGIRIDEGTDRNYNNVLDPDEVEQSEVICNGAPGEAGADGLDVLQSIEPAPADATCTEGGWRVSAGRDLNGDGRLQREEIESAATICNGLRGADGQDGPAGPVGREGQGGPVGPEGARGPSGPQGEVGPAGESGCRAAPGQAPSGGWLGLIFWGLWAFRPWRDGPCRRR